jgi:hypothetical protein
MSGGRKDHFSEKLKGEGMRKMAEFVKNETSSSLTIDPTHFNPSLIILKQTHHSHSRHTSYYFISGFNYPPH